LPSSSGESRCHATVNDAPCAEIRQSADLLAVAKDRDQPLATGSDVAHASVCAFEVIGDAISAGEPGGQYLAIWPLAAEDFSDKVGGADCEHTAAEFHPG
jgi:hypothetical protein